MTYFQGLQALTLDNKGRITIPSRYRDIFRIDKSFSLIITLDLAGLCLWLYPLVHWETITQKIHTLPSLDPEVMRLQRLLIGHASQVEIDNQGRLLIPPVIRECAKLDKQAVLMGQGSRFELWDATILEQQRQNWLVSATESSGLKNKAQEIIL